MHIEVAPHIADDTPLSEIGYTASAKYSPNDQNNLCVDASNISLCQFIQCILTVTFLLKTYH